jgi:N-acetylglucosaminyldiphosphoundecaprenol N-acetyl-beta-D-mannosaminyltransferase
MRETVNLIDESIANKIPIHHVVVNAAKLVHAQKDTELKGSIINCDIINPDGQSVVWASKFLNDPLKERVAGIDLMSNLVDLAYRKNYKIFLLGAEEEIVKSVANLYSQQYGSHLIAGYRNGYYKKDEEGNIAKQIADSGAHMLFVAITSPKKEIFLNTYKDIIKTPFIMGVGGSFDVISGKTKRAPKWVQKVGMEWLFRVLQEPRRLWKRYLTTNSAFIFLVLKEKFSFKN